MTDKTIYRIESMQNGKWVVEWTTSMDWAAIHDAEEMAFYENEKYKDGIRVLKVSGNDSFIIWENK